MKNKSMCLCLPYDAGALIDSIEKNATVNEAEGWVRNVPQGDIESQLQAFQSQIEDYISNQNPEATVGDVLGLQEIRIIPPRPLSAGLPYKEPAGSGLVFCNPAVGLMYYQITDNSNDQLRLLTSCRRWFPGSAP